MAMKTEVCSLKSTKPIDESTLSNNSDGTDSDDEFGEDLGKLAIQVANEMKNKISSPTRVMNLRNKNITIGLDLPREQTPSFYIDKKPNDTEKGPPVSATKSQVATSSANDSSSSDDDDNDNDVAMLNKQKADRRSRKIKRAHFFRQARLQRWDKRTKLQRWAKLMGDSRSKRSQSQFQRLNLSSALQENLDSDVYVDLDNYQAGQKKSIASTRSVEMEIMKKSVITPDFEKKDSISPYSESVRQMKKQRRKERDMTKGKNWFDMKAPEMTEELKNDLTVIQYRNVLDPKRFYKAPDLKTLPKYFQVGTVVDNPADFYHSRIPKKERKRTLVDELLADADYRRYNKKKYTEVIMEKAKRTGAYKDIKFPKKLKLKKKKHKK